MPGLVAMDANRSSSSASVPPFEEIQHDILGSIDSGAESHYGHRVVYVIISPFLACVALGAPRRSGKTAHMSRQLVRIIRLWPGKSQLDGPRGRPFAIAAIASVARPGAVRNQHHPAGPAERRSPCRARRLANGARPDRSACQRAPEVPAAAAGSRRNPDAAGSGRPIRRRRAGSMELNCCRSAPTRRRSTSSIEAARTLAASNWRLRPVSSARSTASGPISRDACANGTAELFALGTVSGRPGLFIAQRVEARAHPRRHRRQGRVRPARSSLGAPARADLRHRRHGVVIITSRPDWRFRSTRPLDAATLAADAPHPPVRLAAAARRSPLRSTARVADGGRRDALPLAARPPARWRPLSICRRSSRRWRGAKPARWSRLGFCCSSAMALACG